MNPSSDDFALDARLAADTVVLGDLPLCRACLMNDARFAWLILVPRRTGVSEIDQLTPTDQATLWAEVNQAIAALRATVPVDKLNIGALGNIVRQLHIHVIARRENDAAWPGPGTRLGRRPGASLFPACIGRAHGSAQRSMELKAHRDKSTHQLISPKTQPNSLVIPGPASAVSTLEPGIQLLVQGGQELDSGFCPQRARAAPE